MAGGAAGRSGVALEGWMKLVYAGTPGLPEAAA